ncbi:MAG: ADP-ribosylglycohydrolase family protein [Bacteroidaceae bacterium]|nr:ADP-ribosylglycohydrolase family protein [Bacteroidaceae bacterium]
MLGAIIGDIAGSRFEFNNHRSTDFELFGAGCSFTDDSVMTIAVAYAILNNIPYSIAMQIFGRKYPHVGYGSAFKEWLLSPNPAPYNSFGNGAAMRVSPCAFMFRHNRTIALGQATVSASCSHDHKEGIKGANAITDAILMAFDKLPKSTIRNRIASIYGYDLYLTCDELRATNTFDTSCQVTVPQAIIAFLESKSFTNAIKLAVSIGGDSDTIASMTGAIAEAYYGIPKTIAKKAKSMLPSEFNEILDRMYNQIE